MKCVIIEPNLRGPSGHYADFVRALGSRGLGEDFEVFAHPGADPMLAQMEGVRVRRGPPRVGDFLAEWRLIFRSVREGWPFLVLTADGRHAAAVSAAAALSGTVPDNARLFFHRPPSTSRDRYALTCAGAARRSALAIAPTDMVAEWLRADGWQRVVMVPYPVNRGGELPVPAPFSHLLMAGAARINKGLDLVAGLAVNWAGEGRDIPLLVQVSRKHAGRHGRREGGVVDMLLNSGYGALEADDSAPDRAVYLARFRGALVLAPYAREQFASQVSGVVLDALLNGAPVIATSGTWPGTLVERFGAGVTITDRTPGALAAAIDLVLADWHHFSDRACAAAAVLAREHDPCHLYRVLLA